MNVWSAHVLKMEPALTGMVLSFVDVTQDSVEMALTVKVCIILWNIKVYRVGYGNSNAMYYYIGNISQYFRYQRM